MTIKLLAPRDLPYGDRTVTYPVGAIVTLATATETGLINSKEATSDLTGGFAYTPPTPSGQPRDLQYTMSPDGVVAQFGDVAVPLKNAPRKRPVANRCGHNSRVHATNRQINSESIHTIFADTSELWMTFANYYVAATGNGNGDGTETTLGAATLTVGVEYPVGSGTYYQVTFNGAVTGATSAALFPEAYIKFPFVIPKFSQIAVRACLRGTTGVPYRTHAGDTGLGKAQLAVSGLSDTSMGGTITPTQAGTFYRPCKISAVSTTPAIGLVPDSRGQGFNDAPTSGIGFVGEFGRSIEPYFPVVDLSQQSDMAQNFVGSCATRLALLADVDVVIWQLGINDLKAATPATAAQLIGWLKQFQTAIGKPVIPCTVAPYTTSTDSWATTANQTVRTYEAQRVAYNTALRGGGIPGICGPIEIADVLETARDSGIWRAPGYTTDGLHESALANIDISMRGNVLQQVNAVISTLMI